MAVVIKYSYFFLVFIVLFCSNCSDSKSEQSPSIDEGTKMIALRKEIVELSGLDSLGSNFNLVSVDTFMIDSSKLIFKRRFEKTTLEEIRIEAFPKDSLSKSQIKGILTECLTGESQAECEKNFCSWYRKSKNNIDVEILFFDESLIRGFPYLAFRILEKDGIAE